MRQKVRTKSKTGNRANNSISKRVFIVDDHPVYREGLAQIINGERDLRVCGEADDAEHALRNIPELKPDLVVVDISLPGKGGMELLKDLRLCNGLKLLVVSMHDEALYAHRVLRAGADGYIMKQEDPDEIVRAMRDVLSGRIYVSESVLATRPKTIEADGAGKQDHSMHQLTDDEIEVLGLLAEGKSNTEIARELHCRAATVPSRYAEMQKKLKINSLNALIRYAVCWARTDRS